MGDDASPRTTDSGIEIQPIYELPEARVDRPNGARRARRVPLHPRRLPRMYRGRLWTMRQYAGMGTPRRRTGASGTSSSRGRPACPSPSTCRRRWATTPTTRGPRARSARSASRSTRSRTWSGCFDGIPLDQVTTSMTINATAPILLLLYELVAEEQGVDPSQARRHGPERHAEGVHRPRDVHLPARSRRCA